MAQAIVGAVNSLPGATVLSSAQRAVLSIVRTGAAPWIVDMASLAMGDTRFSVLPINPQNMLDAVDQFNALDPAITAASMATQVLTDTSRSVLADAWKQTLAIYGLAQTLAKGDAVLELRLAKMATFMSKKPLAHKKTTAATNEAPVAASASEPPPLTVTTTTSQPVTSLVRRTPRAEDHRKEKHDWVSAVAAFHRGGP